MLLHHLIPLLSALAGLGSATVLDSHFSCDDPVDGIETCTAVGRASILYHAEKTRVFFEPGTVLAMQEDHVPAYANATAIPGATLVLESHDSEPELYEHEKRRGGPNSQAGSKAPKNARLKCMNRNKNFRRLDFPSITPSDKCTEKDNKKGSTHNGRTEPYYLCCVLLNNHATVSKRNRNSVSSQPRATTQLQATQAQTVSNLDAITLDDFRCVCDTLKSFGKSFHGGQVFRQ